MTPERKNVPLSPQKKPYEIFGLSDKEAAWWRLTDARFREIIFKPQTIIHRVSASSNSHGDFLFVTTSRLVPQGRVGMTFFGMGYHEQSDRWITDEWYWFQTTIQPHMLKERITKEETEKLLEQRKEIIKSNLQGVTRKQQGEGHEILADLKKVDSALVEMGDLASLDDWLAELDRQTPPQEPPPTGENLLDPESRAKLPKLSENLQQRWDSIAQVKFFTPDGSWAFFASEFDGENTFFGLVLGPVAVVGHFSLSDLQALRDSRENSVERDVHLTPKPLRDLKENQAHKPD
jgi:hypothetical protein